MTMVKNEGRKRKGKGERKARNSYSSKAVGLVITAAKATTMHSFQ